MKSVQEDEEIKVVEEKEHGTSGVSPRIRV